MSETLKAERSVVAGFNLSDVKKEVPTMTINGLEALTSRYLDRTEDKYTETPAGLFKRVAKTMAEVETRYGNQHKIEQLEHAFYEMMINGRFMPNSPTLMNAGRKLGLMSACFVLPIEDDLKGILDTQRAIGLIQSAGGGTGFCLDRLRPSGDFISGSGGTTSGPISFWRSYSATTDAIQQGSFRRGANMMIMSVEHPDILKFIYAKQNLSQFTNYNVSVKITDAFMNQLKVNPFEPIVVTNPRTKRKYLIPEGIRTRCTDAVELSKKDTSKRAALDNCYGLADLCPVDSRDDQKKYVSHGDLWRLIVEHAWATAEPGLFFVDRVREANPTPHIGEIETTNPCGEQPLLPFEACNLGSINLASYVNCNALTLKDEMTDESREAAILWSQFERDVENAVHFLDNVVDANKWPLEEIGKMCNGNRKIGLGVMGLADALFKLGVRYDSPAGLKWIERFTSFLNDVAIKKSIQLAAEKGAFPNWEGSRWQQKGVSIRNADVTTCAPTGTISIIANCSGGIEPLFAIAFTRNVLDGKVLHQSNEWFEQVAKARGFWSEALLKKITENGGSVQGIKEVPEDVQCVFRVAMDIAPSDHVKAQAVCQKHVTNAISKTINMPAAASVNDVADVYMLAYQLGCKGITVYRDGCRSNQPMMVKKDEPKAALVVRAEPVAAITPSCAPAIRVRRETPFGTLHVNVVVDPVSKTEIEIFAQMGRAGEHVGAMLEGLCRIGSLWLRAGGNVDEIRNQWLGIKCTLPVKANGNGQHTSSTSLPNELAMALVEYAELKAKHGIMGLLTGRVDEKIDPEAEEKIKKLRQYADQRNNQTGTKLKCPNSKCSGTIIHQEGCSRCSSCNYTAC